MRKAAATPSAIAAMTPFSSPRRGLTVKAVAYIARPATTAAMWVKVGAISVAGFCFQLPGRS